MLACALPENPLANLSRALPTPPVDRSGRPSQGPFDCKINSLVLGIGERSIASLPFLILNQSIAHER